MNRLLTRRAIHVMERKLLTYRHQWWVLALGALEPVLYLVGMGIGVGTLVGQVTVHGDTVDYLTFIAPALMASAAMNGALDDVIFGLLFDLRDSKIHEITLATPIEPTDLAAGEVLGALLRGTIYSTTFLVIITAIGAVPSMWGLATIPAAGLIGLSFACLGCAVTTYLKTHADLYLANLVLTPLFLFSATFFPASRYPGPLQIVAELSPLTRAADLLRSLSLGSIQLSIAVDVGYLVLFGGIGLIIAGRRLNTQLRK